MAYNITDQPDTEVRYASVCLKILAVTNKSPLNICRVKDKWFHFENQMRSNINKIEGKDFD
jgi:hypothetical protein